MNKPVIVAAIATVAFIATALSKANVKKQLNTISKSHSDDMVVLNAMTRVADAVAAGATEAQLSKLANEELAFIKIALQED